MSHLQHLSGDLRPAEAVVVPSLHPNRAFVGHWPLRSATAATQTMAALLRLPTVHRQLSSTVGADRMIASAPKSGNDTAFGDGGHGTAAR